VNNSKVFKLEFVALLMPNKEYYELLKVGLTEGEAKAYLALSELGSCTVGPIVKKSGIAYSNIYDVLDRLIKKGLVSFVIKSKTKHFQAAPPVNLVDYLDKKEKEIISQRENLKHVLKDLESLHELKETQEAEVFIGKNGLKAAYEKLFKNELKNEEYLFFYIYEEKYAEESNYFYNSIVDSVKQFKIRGIANKEWKNSWFAKKIKFWKVKFVDFPIPGNIDIVKDKVFIVSWTPSPVGILIHSKEIADNFKSYFNEVWKKAK